jgi:hypothetical protein
MSQDYGKDVKLRFNTDGTIDFAVSVTGDIDIVGGDEDELLEIRKQAAIQMIKFLLLTPLGSILDPNTNAPSNVGSEISGNVIPGQEHQGVIGDPMSGFSLMFLNSYIISSLKDVPFIQSIDNVTIEEGADKGVVKVRLDVTIQPDNIQLEVELDLP